LSIKHGHKKDGKTTHIYKLWENLKQRTGNPNHPRFADWGGRGVTMYAPWRDSFMPFALYITNTIGDRPTTKHSLDRINNAQGYIPGNLKWSTAKEQAANRRVGVMPQTRWLNFRGQDYSVNGFAKLIGKTHKAVMYRLSRFESLEEIAEHFGYSNVPTLSKAA
jgi:hypothetical protein